MAQGLRDSMEQMERANILIAIDDFSMTEHLKECLEPLVRDHPTATVHLFHALGPLPPQLLESPGAEDPVEEEKIEARQERQQERWLARARAGAAPLLHTAIDEIRGLRSPAIDVQSHFLLLNHHEDLVDEIIKAARDYRCGHIVVGHHSHPWLRERLHTHTGVRLKSTAPELSVCVLHP